MQANYVCVDGDGTVPVESAKVQWSSYALNVLSFLVYLSNLFSFKSYFGLWL